MVKDKNGHSVKQGKKNPKFLFAFGEKNDKGESDINTPALAFFVCQFLEKKFANMLLDSVGIEKTADRIFSRFDLIENGKEDYRTLLKRIFTITCARLPRTRLECDSLLAKHTLGMDILNYLPRCPDTLYNLLSAKNQMKFRAISETTNEDILLKRFNDRFTYLTLNFLDRIEAFPQLRFCVDMGNYHFNRHRRPVIDGSTLENRWLSKKILCYTRIQDAIRYYQTERSKIDTLYVSPSDETVVHGAYRQDMLPQYSVCRRNNHDKRIGFALKSLERYQKNKADLNLFNQPTLDPEGRKQNKPKTYKPDGWISAHELMPMLFLAENNIGEEIEHKITDYIVYWRNFLTSLLKMDSKKLKAAQWKNINQTKDDYCREFQNTYHLNIMDIPDEFRYYLLNSKIKPVTVSQTAETWLVGQCNITRSLIRQLESEQSYDFKLGRGRTRRFTKGFIAQWLVRDFMQFQHSNKSAADHFGKLKSSPDYMALQSALTCFESRKDSMKNLFISARLIDGRQYDHPFLKDVIKNGETFTTLEHFFHKYLRQRLEWLRCADGKEAYQLRRLYKHSTIKTNIRTGILYAEDYLHQLSKSLLDQPCCLPRGLFDELVRETLKKQFPDEYAAAVSSCTRSNFTWLMQQYLKWRNDQSQWFYSLTADMESKPFKSLFTLMGTAQLRYDAQGVKNLNEVLQVTQSKRKQELVKKLQSDNQYNKMNKDEQQEEIVRRMETQENMYRHLLDQLGQAWKDIRQASVQDALLMDAAVQLLPLNMIQLKTIKPENDLQQQRRERRLNPENVISGELGWGSILNCPCCIRHTIKLPYNEGTIVLKGTMKYKNFGNFNWILSDMCIISFYRLYKLLGYNEVEYKTLVEHEIDFYDRIARPAVFQWLHNLESKVVDRYPDIEKKQNGGYINFSQIAEKASNGNNLYDFLLIMIRNAFAHNNYPDFQPDTNATAKDKSFLTEQLKKIKEDFQAALDSSTPEKPACLSEVLVGYTEKLFKEVIDSL